METILQKALKLLLDKFGAEYDCVTITEENGQYRANIETPNAARLIGKSGETLSAIQTLLKNMLFAQNKENVFISVDVDNYRKAQEERVIEKAERFIDMMKERNLSEVKLPPMPPYFRRVVHVWIVHTFPELQSDSVGEGRDRAVRVSYK